MKIGTNRLVEAFHDLPETLTKYAHRSGGLCDLMFN